MRHRKRFAPNPLQRTGARKETREMEPSKKIVNQMVNGSKPGAVVPMRTYKPKTVADLSAVFQGEAAVGKGKALVTVTFSAELANEVLEKCNHGNRPIRRGNLAAWTQAMSDGRWGDSTLIFGLFDGVLRIGDAQHRMLAQKGSGTEQTYAVWVYTDDDEFQSAVRRVDSKGSARNVRDLLVIEGLMTAGHGQFAEAALNKMVMFDGTNRNGVTTDLETRLVYAERRIKSLLWVVSGIPTRTFKPSVLGALVFAHSKDPKATEELIQRVVAGDGLRAQTAEHTFALNKESLNCARSAAECRRAMATVLRLVSDHKEGRRVARKVEVMCQATRDAVERYAGKTAWSILESDKKRA